MTYITNYSSKLGDILLASDGDNLTGLWFKNQKYYLNKITDELLENPNLEIFHKTKKWLDKYFQGIKVTPNQLKLKPNGSPFQQEVWKILCNIPYGKTITYGEIAKEIAQKQGKKSMSAQAVGGAVGHNPISIIIPCHRVVGSNSSLTGYAGGIDKKIALLELEKANINNCFMSQNLKFQDFAFEYQKNDLTDAKLKYSVTQFTKNNGDIINTITFEVSAKNKEKIEYTLEFTLLIPLYKLNAQLTNISNYVDSTIYLYNSYTNQTEVLDFLTEQNSSLYNNPSNCWATKTDDKFFIKLAIPSEAIFLWFYF